MKIKRINKIYLSGPITDDPDYKLHFQEHREKLIMKGYTVLDPTVWTRENLQLKYDEYMKLDLAMLSICDAIYMLPGWANSRGAKIEMEEAGKLGLRIYYA